MVRRSGNLGTDPVALLSGTLFTSCSSRDTRCCSCLLAGAPSPVLLLLRLVCPLFWLVLTLLNFSCRKTITYSKTHPFRSRKCLVFLYLGYFIYRAVIEVHQALYIIQGSRTTVVVVDQSCTFYILQACRSSTPVMDTLPILQA